MIAMLLAGLTLVAQEADAEPLLPDGRYAEDVSEGDACANKDGRFFTLVPADPSDPAEYGSIVADFGGAVIDMPLSMTSMHARDLADGAIQGVGVVQARDASSTRLMMTLLLGADGRYVVGQVLVTPQGGEMQHVVRMVDDPLPHGIASDGSVLEPFRYCGPQ